MLIIFANKLKNQEGDRHDCHTLENYQDAEQFLEQL